MRTRWGWFLTILILFFIPCLFPSVCILASLVVVAAAVTMFQPAPKPSKEELEFNRLLVKITCVQFVAISAILSVCKCVV